jgi:hypothetical protein
MEQTQDPMGGHQLIFGQLTDYISGVTLDDTLDERHRQKIGRLLVEQKGYDKHDIVSRHEITIRTGSKCAKLLITYIVTLAGRMVMLIQYGPGSLVTRHRPALAMSRLAAEYQIPVVVVTNGEDADILNGEDASVVARGIDQIPPRQRLAAGLKQQVWETISRRRGEMESRILMAYEVDDKCPCDDSICTIDNPNDGGFKTPL